MSNVSIELDKAPACLEIAENIEGFINVIAQSVETILEQAKATGVEKFIVAAQKLHDEVVDISIASQKELAGKYTEMAEEMQKLNAAFSL